MTPLREWPRDAGERTAYADSIFRSIAARYDLFTRVLSFGQDRRWKRRALDALPPGRDAGRVLDLACGTGALPILLREDGFRGPIVGLDRSFPMLAVCARRLRAAGADQVELSAGDLNALPFADGSADVVTMGYGLRYLTSIPGSLAHIHRILRPGGVFVSLDFGVPPHRWYRRLAFAYLLALGTLWGVLLHGRPGTYWHIVESLRAYPGQRVVADWMRGAGFRDVSVREQLGGVAAIVAGRKAADRDRPS
jgi:demethylmenaquinone methyltransferase/2-methoxy-6-polyprenyl-1,4-benzoquinol methylase